MRIVPQFIRRRIRGMAVWALGCDPANLDILRGVDIAHLSRKVSGLVRALAAHEHDFMIPSKKETRHAKR